MINQRWQWERQDVRHAIGGYAQDGFESPAQLVNFTCSHDEVRPEHEIKFYSGRHIALPAGMTLQQAAMLKAQLGLVVLFTAPGVPMIYAGQEFGEDTPRTIDFLPLSWEKLKLPAHARHYRIDPRSDSASPVIMRPCAATTSASMTTTLLSTSSFAMSDIRPIEGIGARILLPLPSISTVSQSIRLSPCPIRGAWRDVISGRRYRPRGIEIRLTLQSVAERRTCG